MVQKCKLIVEEGTTCSIILSINQSLRFEVLLRVLYFHLLHLLHGYFQTVIIELLKYDWPPNYIYMYIYKQLAVIVVDKYNLW